MRHETPARQLAKSIEVYLDIVETYRDFHNFINHIMLSLSTSERHIVYQAESRVVEHFAGLIQAGIDRGEFSECDARLVAHNIVAMANAWANRGWYLKRYYTLESYSGEQIKLTLAQLEKSRTAEITI
jgi:hypothetical protein